MILDGSLGGLGVFFEGLGRFFGGLGGFWVEVFGGSLRISEGFWRCWVALVFVFGGCFGIVLLALVSFWAEGTRVGYSFSKCWGFDTFLYLLPNF